MEWGKRKDGQPYPKDGKGHGITSELENSIDAEKQKLKNDYAMIFHNEKTKVGDGDLTYNYVCKNCRIGKITRRTNEPIEGEAPIRGFCIRCDSEQDFITNTTDDFGRPIGLC